MKLADYPSWVRWSLVPIVFAGASLGIHILSIFGFWLWRTIGIGKGVVIEHDSIFAKFQDHILVGFLVGYFSVYLAVKMAPEGKFITSLVLAGVAILGCGVTLTYVLLERESIGLSQRSFVQQ